MRYVERGNWDLGWVRRELYCHVLKNWAGRRYCGDLGFTFSREFKEQIRQHLIQRVQVFRCSSASNGGRGVPEPPAFLHICDCLFCSRVELDLEWVMLLFFDREIIFKEQFSYCLKCHWWQVGGYCWFSHRYLQKYSCSRAVNETQVFNFPLPLIFSTPSFIYPAVWENSTITLFIIF